MGKRILCYGDSNTYGSRPGGRRYDEHTRWPMRLQEILGPGYTVIEEGFGGRTTVFDDPVEGGYKSGIQYLPPCLMSHNPLHLVIIMLGTNDLKQRFQMSTHTIAEGASHLIRLSNQYSQDDAGNPAKVLLMSPPPIGDWVMDTLLGPIFGPQSPEVSRGLPAAFSRFARLMRCEYLDAGLYAHPSREDAVHFTEKGHLALAEAVGREAIRILS